MVSFKGKSIIRGETIGEILRAYREERGFSIKDVSIKLGFAPHFIELIESNKFHKLPGNVYVKNFIKRYAELVHLNSSEVLEKYKKECPLFSNDSVSKKNFITRVIAWWNPVLIKRMVGVAILIVVVGYIGMQARNIFSPPILVIQNPENGFVSKDRSIKLVGRSLPETKIQINGREMVADMDGGFSETLDLTPGVNTFTIVAIKKHGAKTVAVRNVLFEEKVSLAPSNSEFH